MQKLDLKPDAPSRVKSPFTHSEVVECERRAEEIAAGKVKALTLAEMRTLGILPKKKLRRGP
jgi:hypothetical protein